LPNSSWILPADPKSNYLAHKNEIDEAVSRVLESGWYILGKEVASFEQEFGNYLGAGSVIGVGNGTDALQLALRACGVGQGDAVITVSHTAVATVAAIELAGAWPVLVDINPNTFTLDPDRAEETIKRHHERENGSAGTPRIRAIIPVHLYGHPADMPAIMDIAGRHDLIVIEDCAQSNGAEIEGRKTGTWGHLATFSFYPTKNLCALGDGGAVVTNSQEMAERARGIREYGWRERYISDFPGMNTRLDELQAAILRVKLRYLDEENARRREIARNYDARLSATRLTLPRSPGNLDHVYHQYVVRSGRRNQLREFLKSRSIGTLIHYPVPVHLQPAYRGRFADLGSLPHTEKAAAEILSLPMFPEISEGQIASVADAILEFDKLSF
jgi:dTDP-4-amino-4,6-dideoxygalactose transaminase